MDEQYMKRVLHLAEKGIGKTSPNPMVGAVIVKNGEMIGEGFHEKYGQAHAEVNAIRNAVESVEGSTIYVNLEPCSHYGKTPPCVDLIIEKRLERVVIGSLDPNPRVAGRGIKKLENAGIEVTLGLLEEECKKLNEVFMHYITTKHPFVVLKTAMSLDGKIATVLGESKWITGEEARLDVQGLRNRLTAIMVGVNTVITDNPQLTCRLKDGRNPIRIIVDSRLRIPHDSWVLKNQVENQTIIATTELAPKVALNQLEGMGAKIMICNKKNDQVDLHDLMSRLGALNIDSILLEGGSTLNDSALANGIVHKMITYVAPMIIGGATSKTPVGGMGIATLDQAYPLNIDSMERVGYDMKITAYLKQREEPYCLPELLKN